MSSLVILVASVFEISCGTTDKRTHRETNSTENPTPTTSFGVDNSNNW